MEEIGQSNTELILGIIISIFLAYICTLIISGASLDETTKNILIVGDIITFGAIIVGCIYGILKP
jgi:TctA family transporter